MPTVFIVIYSLYHHIYKVALEIQKGLEAQGVDVKIFQVPETLPEEVLVSMHAPPKPDLPIITVDELGNADGFLFGIPTRFGSFPAQMKSFLDATSSLWASGSLAGKFAGTFFSTASQHGGQETTAYTMLTYFAHHGINYVPLGFANTHLFDNSEVVGGSLYGAGTVANGDGSRQPSTKELEIANSQGENFAKLLTVFHRGLNKQKEEVTSDSNAAATDATTATIAATDANTEVAADTKKNEEPVAQQVEATPAPKEEPKTEAKKETKAEPKTEEKKKDSKCFCM